MFVSVFFFSKSSAPQLKKFYRFSFESTAQPEYLLRNEKKPPVDGTVHTRTTALGEFFSRWDASTKGCLFFRLQKMYTDGEKANDEFSQRFERTPKNLRLGMERANGRLKLVFHFALFSPCFGEP